MVIPFVAVEGSLISYKCISMSFKHFLTLNLTLNVPTLYYILTNLYKVQELKSFSHMSEHDKNA